MPSNVRLPRALMFVGAVLIALSPMSTMTAHAASTVPQPDPVASPGWTGGAPLPPSLSTTPVLARNEDGEPGMGVAPDGQIWVASDVAPYASDDPRALNNGLLTGADIWTSTDGGQSYRWVADPFSTGNEPGAAGEDTDLAVAPAKNSAGYYNVYATSLWVGASSLAWSADGGKTWTVNQLGGVPAQDRPWLAADGACTVYLAYHQLPSFTPTVSKYDVCSAGQVPQGMGATLDPVNQTNITLSTFPGASNSFNKIAVDPKSHALYVPGSVCTVQSADDIVTNATASNCPKGTQYVVSVSTDGGSTFKDYPVVNDPSGATLVWAATVAADAAGTAYFTWSDSSNSYLDVSHDGGKTWSAPEQLNAPGTSAVYPTVAGGTAGRVDVAWYGTNRAGNSNDDKVMGAAGAATGAPWAVYVARSTDSGQTFTTSQASNTIHRGILCTHGSSCNSDGSRNLLDDFGLTISPTTGLDSIAFTSDQPDNSAGHAFTGFTSQIGTPGPSVPEAPLPVLLALLGTTALGGGVWLRRRTAS